MRRITPTDETALHCKVLVSIMANLVVRLYYWDPMNTIINVTTPRYQVYTRANAPLPSYDSTNKVWIVHPCVQTDRVIGIVDTVVSKKTPAVTPGYRARLKAGGFIGPLNYYREESILPSSYFRGQLREYGSYPGNSYLKKVSAGLISDSGSYSWPILSTASLLDRADRIAITKLLNSIKDSKANLVLAFTEADKLQKLIGTTTVKLGFAYKLLRAGRLSAAAQSLGLRVGKREASRYAKSHRQLKTNADIDKMMSNGVLSVQYGIRPLIQDVIGAAELFAQKTSHEVINTCQSRGVAEDSGKSKRTNDYTSNSLTDNICDIDYRYTVKYGCNFAHGNESVHTLKQMGFSNPFLLAWELLPWSFVIDWFIPIGNYLSSIDATLGLKFISGWKSVRKHESTVLTCSWRPNPGRPDRYAFHIGDCVQNRRVDSFERTTLSSFPSPVLPRFKNPLSWEHAVNGISLLAGFKKEVYFRKK